VAFYTVFLIFGLVHTALALLAFARAERGSLPWAEVAAGVAEVCCALLLRLYFDPPFRDTLGPSAWALFLFALTWSVMRWATMMWGLAEDSEPTAGSILGALGVGLSSGMRRIGGILWHVGFVAPSLVCGAFVLLGLAGELPPR
jgi:hypothetical protein